jgi:CHAT domain-containing protein
LAQEAKRADLQSFVLNDLGALQLVTRRVDAAIRSFDESIRLARESGLPSLEITARINLSITLMQEGRLERLDGHLAESYTLAKTLPDSWLKAFCLLSIGTQYWSSQWRFGLAAIWRSHAYEAYRNGMNVAENIGDRRLVSYAMGCIGRLYEDERRPEEALRYTRSAAFRAQECDAADVQYLWEWQTARILRDGGRSEESLGWYRRALRTLEGIRPDLARSGVPFQRFVDPLFRELADLLLRRASGARDDQAAQRDLLEVRSTLEQLKQAEIAEYFRDDCVAQTQGTTQLDRVAAKSAVIYPILLPDRTELLVSLPAGLERFTVAVGLAELTSVIRQFRQSIEVFDGRDGFVPHARRLHDWLIRPLTESLRHQQVNTLVMVPDGPLRTIPLSALHDGKAFLIEDYAVATTLGLSLTSARPIARQDAKTLAIGLTEGVQGFSPLPSVAAELANIEAIFPTTRLQDNRFKTASVEQEVSGGAYSIVHFATHGHFDSDHSKSFLLTFDSQITMDGLRDAVGNRRYREEPVELLMLSACETASGDERAALGLAGVGLRAGARSAVASLWSISDESTAILVAEFYRRLKVPGNSRAEALRAAQLALIRQEAYRHPYFWAAFLLVGNWF